VPGPNQITYNLEANPGAATVLGTLLPLAKTWGGLGHLEGKTVDMLGDSGIVFPQQVVVGGQVIYPRAVPNIEIGLHYDSRIKDLPIEVLLPEGSLQGRPVSLSEVRIRLHKTVGLKINGKEQIPFRKFGASVLDKPVAPFSGIKKADVTGWDIDNALTLEQTQPLPFCVLSIIRKVTVGD
jgi:hypothetical protein